MAIRAGHAARGAGRRRCGRDVAGTLAGGRTGTCSSQAGYDAAQSHADSENGRAVAAAGGGTFADAFQCGTDTVLAKAAGKAGIGSILT